MTLGVVAAVLVGATPGPSPAPAVAPVLPAVGIGREALPAQAVDTASPHPGSFLRVEILTMGQGDLVWEKFGHNAIRIIDERTGSDVAWNWGMFHFDQVGFWPRLVRGEMLYSMGAYHTSDALREYAYARRPVWTQELDMTPQQKWRLQSAILEHWRPENREYLYDYYRDNCSTRVRDMLDLALDGAVSAELEGDTTATTYRWHTRRLLGGSPLPYAGIQLVLGNRADRPITRWEEGFLPMRLQAYLRDVRVPGPDGGLRPLVAREALLVEADRAPAPQEAPSRLAWFGALGLVLGGLVAGGAVLAARGRAAGRVAFVGAGVAWSLLAGVGGTLILGAWLFTDHVFWGVNENLLQTSPLSLALVVGLLPALWLGRVPRWAAGLAVAVAVLSVLGFLMQPLPGLDQVNGEIIALALPVNAALAYGAWRLGARAPAEPERAAAGAVAARAA